MKWWINLGFYFLVIFAMICGLQGHVAATTCLEIGGVVVDWLAHAVWGIGSDEQLRILRDNGFTWIQVRATTVSSTTLLQHPPSEWNRLSWQDEFWCSLEYVSESLKRAALLGMKLNLLLFLSAEAAWPCRQNIPPEWRGLTDQKLEKALEKYGAFIAEYFTSQGLHIDLYTIGNEIELGILNTVPGGSCVPSWVWRKAHPYYDVSYVKGKIWPREARLLKAIIRGIRTVDSEAKIALHADSIGRSPQALLPRSFFRAMYRYGVPFDFASITYPSALDKPFFEVPAKKASPYYRTDEFKRIVSELNALGKKVIIGEFSYPNNPVGVNAEPDPGYPYTPEGQAKWVRDFLVAMSRLSGVFAVFYWAPDWFPGVSGGQWPFHESSGLFITATKPLPALKEFAKYVSGCQAK